MVKRASSAVPQVIVSTDSDFIQLLNGRTHVELYNPIKKSYVKTPEYCYCTWKALRGDPSDNIDSVLKGSQKSKDDEARRLLDDPEALKLLLSMDDNAKVFSRNLSLIEFEFLSDDELLAVESSTPTKDWEHVKTVFDSYGFKSITEKGWDKFVATFNPLFGENDGQAH
jgi:hypothetical protein